MNTTTTTIPTTGRLTAADLETLDIQELLNGIFASDVDLEQLLKEGVKQVRMSNAMIKAAEKAQRKHERKIARAIKTKENLQVNLHLSKTLLSGGVAALATTAVVITPGINIPLAGIAATHAMRTAFSAKQTVDARRLRDLVREGAIVEEDSMESLKATLGNSRFDTILALIDAGFMVELGWAEKEPVALACAAVNLLVAGYLGARWYAASTTLRAQQDPEAIEVTVKTRKPGAHRAGRAMVFA